MKKNDFFESFRPFMDFSKNGYCANSVDANNEKTRKTNSQFYITCCSNLY